MKIKYRFTKLKYQLVCLYLFSLFISCSSPKTSEKQISAVDTVINNSNTKPDSTNNAESEKKPSEWMPPLMLLMQEYKGGTLLGTSQGDLATSQKRSELIAAVMAGGGNPYKKISIGGDNQHQMKFKTLDYELMYQVFYGKGSQHTWAIYEKKNKHKWNFRLLTSNKEMIQKADLATLSPDIFKALPYLDKKLTAFTTYFSLDSLGFRAKSTGKIILQWTGDKFKINQQHLNEFQQRLGVTLTSPSPCQGYQLGNTNKAQLEAPILQAIQTTSVASLSSKKRYLTYLKENQLYLYDFSSKNLKKIFEVSAQTQGLSVARWASNEEKLAFVQLTPAGTSLVTIDLNKEDSTAIQIHPISLRYQQKPDCMLIQADLDFFDDHTLQYMPLGDSLYSYVFLHLDQQTGQNQLFRVVPVGYNGLEQFHYTIAAQQGDTAIKNLTLQPDLTPSSNWLKPSISPDQKYLCYLSKESKSNDTYQLNIAHLQKENHPVSSLLKLDFHEETGSFSSIIWSPDNKRFALVKLEEPAQPPNPHEPTTLYVFEVADDTYRLLLEKKIPIRIHFEVGCVTKAGTDFWFEDAKTIHYKKHTSVDEEKTEVIHLSTD